VSALKGQLALITGASSGIGLAVAKRLADSGMNLLLVARDEAKLGVTRERLLAGDSDIQIDTLALDLSLSAAELSQTLNTVDVPKLSVLVHSAGAYSATQILELPPAELEVMFRVNASSALVLAQHFSDPLVAAQGQIVFVNSSAGRATATAGTGGYAATKHAAAAVADSLRDALNDRGVRVLSVYPGRTATPMQEAIFAAEGRDYPGERLLQSTDIADTLYAALTLPRSAEITEVAIRPMQKT